jgi:4-hydroxy-2-oxoheptanedioate aldolase
MRLRSFALVVLLAILALPVIDAQTSRRLNPMIVLHEQGLPVFGITHPPIVAARGGRGGPGAASTSEGNGAIVTPPLPSLIDAARETVAYRFADFDYNSYASANAERFMGYMAAMLAAGGSMASHAFISKVPIVHTNPDGATARIVEQLNMGHAGIIMQEVESADEVRTALAAMRFRSRGGMRPDEGIGLAAAYWGLTEAQYREKADPWPLNKNGELVLWVIIESKTGIANVREIAAVPGVTVLTVGAGTLGGVFSSTGPDGARVRDQAGFDAGVASVLAACREFKLPCSYPANNPAEIERLMARGFSVFTMQARNAAGFDAIAAGRRLSGRPLPH